MERIGLIIFGRVCCLCCIRWGHEFDLLGGMVDEFPAVKFVKCL